MFSISVYRKKVVKIIVDNLVDNNSPQYANIRFRFYVRLNSVDSSVLKYLKSFSRETNSMMLEAIRPYWMAVACRDSDSVAGEALQKLAFQAVSALCSRARYLCATFDLNPAAFGLDALGTAATPCPPQLQILAPGVPAKGVEPIHPISPVIDEPVSDALDPESDDASDFDDDKIEAFGFYAAAADMKFNMAGL